MPTVLDPLTDQRWQEIVAELRAGRPRAPEGLRERVRAAAAAPVRPRRTWGGGLRVAVPAAAVLLVVVGGLTAVRTLEPVRGDEVAGSAVPEMEPDLVGAPLDGDGQLRSMPQAGEAAGAPAPFTPPDAAGRLQEQRIALGVRVEGVDGLASATARAMAATRSLGGYVVAARYEAGAEDGDSTLVVRVPVTRVQEAIARLTALGTIVSQDVRLQDLQPAHDRRARELESLRARIARLEQQLASNTLTDTEEAALRSQLVAARRAVEARVRQQRAAEQQGRLARVELTLTTRTPVAPVDDGAATILRRAAELLVSALIWLGAALIVTGPFLLLALVAVAANRHRRRTAEARLLEQP